MAKKSEESRPKVRSLYDELEGWDEMPPSWKPVPGEVLVGVVEGYDRYQGQYGEYRVCLLREATENSLLTVYLSSTVLWNEFAKIRPKIGETIGIKYLGKSEGNNPYHRYKVVVDREVDVNAFFGAASASAPEPTTPEASEDDDIPF
jgi:hypothetical protein